MTTSIRLFLLLFLLCQPQALQAQENAKPVQNRLWMNCGLGIMKWSEKQASPAGMVSASYQRVSHLFTLRYLAHFPLGCEFDCETFKDVSLLYGVASQWRYAHVSLSAGPGVAWLHDVPLPHPGGEPNFGNTHRLGLALAGQLFLRPVRPLGIGLYLYTNINSRRNLRGVMLNLQLYTVY